MARVKYNVVTHGASGIVGDLLEFRQRYGKTIIAKIRAKSNKVSADQLAAREKFRRAAAYGKSVIHDASKRAIYEPNAGGDITPYILAVKDYFTPPVLVSIDTSAYTGLTGSTIEVKATDDTKVASVAVRIFPAGGVLLEEGAAVYQQDRDVWTYITTASNSQLSGTLVVVEISDLPGNMVTGEVLL